MKIESTKLQLINATAITAPAARQRALDKGWTEPQIARHGNQHVANLKPQVRTVNTVPQAVGVRVARVRGESLGVLPVSLTSDGVVNYGQLTVFAARKRADGKGDTFDRTLAALGMTEDGTLSPEALDKLVAGEVVSMWIGDKQYKAARVATVAE